MSTTTAASTPAGSGRRERKKEATRLALHRAAVRLAIEHGLENVTVEAIADAADVSRRTFSNYFSNKEEALLWSYEVWLARLLACVDERPSTEPGWTALAAAADQLLSEEDADPHSAGQIRLLRSNPALAARQVATFAAAERRLVESVAARLPAGPDNDVRARLLAATLLTAIRIAAQTWIAQPDRPLVTVVRELLSIAAESWE